MGEHMMASVGADKAKFERFCESDEISKSNVAD